MDVRRMLQFSFLGFLFCLTQSAVGDGLNFVLVSKNIDDANFVAAARGCAEAARAEGDACMHLGPSGAAHFRAQDKVVRQVLEQEVDGIAISVTNGEFLAKHSLRKLEGRNIPFITFDSDMPAPYQDLRKAYVGPDNEEIGYSLGEIVNQFKRSGSLCLMSASPFDTNLNQRLIGVREALADQLIDTASQPLQGESGWFETGRCPWFNADDSRRAVTQIFAAFTYEDSDAVVSVGGWPLVDTDRLRSVLTEYAEHLGSDKRVFVSATGELRPEDYALLHDGLVQGFVSIDFEAMGREVYRVLKSLSDGRVVDSIRRTPVRQVVRTDLTEETASNERPMGAGQTTSADRR
ncbi:sugar-binding protein [Marinobacter nanhaiticus D15-8W]|nr:substrate-binding domain-containing protein [Marinobacter nanhaiticus]BES71492.1 sugar-binding protein [Marinobacter nanhaiticus D15-8W]